MTAIRLDGGFYTAQEVATLLGMDSTLSIYGWLQGYRRSNSPAIINRQYRNRYNRQEVGFFDLLEIRFINHFRKQGVSLQSLRKAAALARNVLGQQHPFATSKITFMTDTKDIFLKTAERTGDKILLNLMTKNYASYVALKTALAQGVEFHTETGLAKCWFPKPKQFPNIYLNPLIAFGKPVIKGPKIPTKPIFENWRASEKDVDAVADWFDLPKSLAEEAIRFEVKFTV